MPKNKCFFDPTWAEKYSFVKSSSKGSNYFWCVYCSSDLSCANGGKTDLEKHIRSKNHFQKERARTQSKLSLFDSFAQGSANDKASAAELALVYHTVKHHHSYSSLDCTAGLLKKILPDSNIAASMSCGKTKAAAIAHNVLAPHSVETLVEEIVSNNWYFSVSTDASNKKDIKCFPLVLKYFHPEKGLKFLLLDFYEDSDECAKSVKEQIVNKLKLYGLKIENVSSFSADNASVNYGVHNGVYARLTKENPKIIKSNCLAHVLHNASNYAVDQLAYDVENLVLKVYAHFSRSAVRRQELKDIFEFLDAEWTPLLSHVSTRFLSLLPALDRILLNWDPLQRYFQSLPAGESKLPKIIRTFFCNETSDSENQRQNVGKYYMYFLSHILKIINELIVKLESNSLTVTTVYSLMEGLIEKFEARKSQQFFGAQMSSFLKRVSESEQSKIKADLLNFYDYFMNYLQKRYDFSDANFHKSLQCLNLESEFSFESLVRACDVVKIDVDTDKLFDEYALLCKYQSSLVTGGKDALPVVQKYVQFFETVGKSCQQLLKLMSVVLSINCSNCEAERIFSLMRQVWTSQRSSLSIDSVRAELQIIVNSQDEKCDKMYKDFLKSRKLLNASASSQKYGRNTAETDQ